MHPVNAYALTSQGKQHDKRGDNFKYSKVHGLSSSMDTGLFALLAYYNIS
jgi:hypothetical protein